MSKRINKNVLNGFVKQAISHNRYNSFSIYIYIYILIVFKIYHSN